MNTNPKPSTLRATDKYAISYHVESGAIVRKIMGEAQCRQRVQAFAGSQRKLPISRDMYTEC